MLSLLTAVVPARDKSSTGTGSVGCSRCIAGRVERRLTVMPWSVDDEIYRWDDDVERSRGSVCMDDLVFDSVCISVCVIRTLRTPKFEK